MSLKTGLGEIETATKVGFWILSVSLFRCMLPLFTLSCDFQNDFALAAKRAIFE